MTGLLRYALSMPPGDVSFSVIVPTLGRTDSLGRTIRNVLATQPGPLEVLVVDGDPEEGARSLVEEIGDSRVDYAATETGLTRQRNVGIARARGDVVVFLDDDVEIPQNTFAALGDAFRDEGLVGATGRIDEPHEKRIAGRDSALRGIFALGGKPGTFTSYGFPRRLTSDAPEQDVETMQGCFMAVRRTVAADVGFDESLPGYGLGEDEDFSYRLSREGRIRYLPDLVIHHDNIGFLTRDRRSFGLQVARNRAYLFRKNFPQTLAARIRFRFFMVLQILFRMINRRWDEAGGMLKGMRSVRK